MSKILSLSYKLNIPDLIYMEQNKHYVWWTMLDEETNASVVNKYHKLANQAVRDNFIWYENYYAGPLFFRNKLFNFLKKKNVQIYADIKVDVDKAKVAIHFKNSQDKLEFVLMFQ